MSTSRMGKSFGVIRYLMWHRQWHRPWQACGLPVIGPLASLRPAMHERQLLSERSLASHAD